MYIEIASRKFCSWILAVVIPSEDIAVKKQLICLCLWSTHGQKHKSLEYNFSNSCGFINESNKNLHQNWNFTCQIWALSVSSWTFIQSWLNTWSQYLVRLWSTKSQKMFNIFMSNFFLAFFQQSKQRFNNGPENERSFPSRHGCCSVRTNSKNSELSWAELSKEAEPLHRTFEPNWAQLVSSLKNFIIVF